MKHLIPAAILVGMLGGTAVAQTTTPATTTPATTTSPGTSNAPATTTAPAAVNTSGANPRTAAAPVPGANSFTEGQARARMEAKGFVNVTALKKDGQGIWRATATKDGKTVAVALDYQGNVVGQ